jgi:hypothetical protein
MKPIADIDSFLQRFNHFKNAQFRSIEVLSPSSILVTLAGQDKARAYDWRSVCLEFRQVVDAKLLENSKCSLLDMQDGISIIKTENTFAFSIGSCTKLASIKTASCYIEAPFLKYKEDEF